jgi:hypothetical protein
MPHYVKTQVVAQAEASRAPHHRPSCGGVLSGEANPGLKSGIPSTTTSGGDGSNAPKRRPLFEPPQTN